MGEKTGKKVGESLGEIDKLNLCRMLWNSVQLLKLCSNYASLMKNQSVFKSKNIFPLSTHLFGFSLSVDCL